MVESISPATCLQSHVSVKSTVDMRSILRVGGRPQQTMSGFDQPIYAKRKNGEISD